MRLALLILSVCATSSFDSRDIPSSEWECASAGTLTVAFNGGPSAHGCETPEVLRPSTVAMPTLTYFDSTKPAATSYTVIIIDRDAPNATEPIRSPLRHMMVAGLSQAQLQSGVAWSNLSPGNNGSSVALFNYSGPNPPAGSGCHRYYVMLYEQASGVSPDIPLNESASRFSWDFPNWARSQSLSKIESATTYWRTQNWDFYAGPCDMPPAAVPSTFSAGAAAAITVSVMVLVAAAAYGVWKARARAAAKSASSDYYKTMNPAA